MQKSPSAHHRTTLSGYVFATKARIDNRKSNLLSSNISPTCPYNMVNFGPLAAEIVSLVTAQPHCGVEQTAPPVFGRAAITLGIGPHF